MRAAIAVTALVALAGCAQPVSLRGAWAGTCLGIPGLPSEGRDVNASITRLVEGVIDPSDPVRVEGAWAIYTSPGFVDDTLDARANAFHCVDAGGCAFDDDPYVEDDVVIHFTRPAHDTAPGNGFLYLHTTADPDRLTGECIIIPAGGAGDVLSGTIELTRTP